MTLSNKIKTALVLATAVGLLALSACGGESDVSVENGSSS